MKINWFLWWIASGFWFILFVIGTAFVWIREVDGSGAIQTTEARAISFIVLLIIFIFPFIIQATWLIISIVVGRNKRKTQHELH